MLSFDTLRSHGRRRFRGRYGVLLFGALMAWTLYVNPVLSSSCCPGDSPCAGPAPACGCCGSCVGNNSATTSSTHHTEFGCPTRAVENVTTSTALGPDTINIGNDLGQSCVVSAGTVNVNTNTDTTTFSCGAAAPALGLPTLALSTLLLGAYAIRRVPS